MSIDQILTYIFNNPTREEKLTRENFLSKLKKEIVIVPDSETLLVFLPHWHNRLSDFSKLEKYVFKKGLSFLAYDYPGEILSSDSLLTRDCFNVLKDTVRSELKEIRKKYKFKKCIVVGVSLGVIAAAMIASGNDDVDEVVYITLADTLAEAMWSGCHTQNIRERLEKQGITLEQLKEIWFPLAPENNVDFKNKSLTIFLSKNDCVIPYKLGAKLAQQMKDSGMNVKINENAHLGHYLTVEKFYFFPKKFLDL